MTSAILLAAILNAKCSVACIYEGYNGGRHLKPDKCLCQDVFEIKDMMSKKYMDQKKAASAPPSPVFEYPYSYKQKLYELD